MKTLRSSPPLALLPAVVLALLPAVVLAACQAVPISRVPRSIAPPPGPTAAANASPAIPAPPSPEAAALEGLLIRMERAVMAGDRESYLANVDLADPAFALEHTRWIDDWAGRNPATSYALDLGDVAIDAESAVGALTVLWSTGPIASYEAPRTATFAARFVLGPEGWRYAGEAWISQEIPEFVIHVAPGLEPMGTAIAAELPAIHDGVTAALGYEPARTMEIKLYADSPSLVANTLLSLPNIAGWNEPGEALKLVNQGDGASLVPTIAHEMTHFIGFDRAGTRRSRMPWWLDEGIATYIGSQVSGRPEDDRLAQVVAWEHAGQLAPWAEMTVFEETSLDLWPFVYSQGYAMVRYVTEELGVEERNAWLAAMATEMDIEEATAAVLGRSFDRLDRGFRAWLAAQR